MFLQFSESLWATACACGGWGGPREGRQLALSRHWAEIRLPSWKPTCREWWHLCTIIGGITNKGIRLGRWTWGRSCGHPASFHHPALRLPYALLFPTSLSLPTNTRLVSVTQDRIHHHAFIHQTFTECPPSAKLWDYTDEFNTHPVLKEFTVQFSSAYITSCEKGP